MRRNDAYWPESVDWPPPRKLRRLERILHAEEERPRRCAICSSCCLFYTLQKVTKRPRRQITGAGLRTKLQSPYQSSARTLALVKLPPHPRCSSPAAARPPKTAAEMTAGGAAPLAAVASVQAGETEDSVVVRSLNFSFPFSRPVIHDLSLELPRGSRCLLTGANGAGVWRGRPPALPARACCASGRACPASQFDAGNCRGDVFVAGFRPLQAPSCARARSASTLKRLLPRPPTACRRQDLAAAGAGGQIHGGAGCCAHPGSPSLPRHPAGEHRHCAGTAQAQQHTSAAHVSLPGTSHG